MRRQISREKRDDKDKFRVKNPLETAIGSVWIGLRCVHAGRQEAEGTRDGFLLVLPKPWLAASVLLL